MENQQKTKWYHNKVLTWIMVFLFFPVGLAMMWSNKKFSVVTKIITTVFLVFIITFGSGGSDTDESVAINSNKPNTEQTESKPTETEKPKTEEKPVEVKKEEHKKYKSGTYKVGTDLPSGEYLVIAKGSCYMEVTSDSTGSLESIVNNENFSTHAFVTVNEGEYLKVRSGEFYSISDMPSIAPTDGKYKEGMYRVGIDIPSGEYRVSPTAGSGYIEVSTDSRGGIYSIVTNDNISEATYITISDGQYLKLNNAKIGE